MKDPGPSLPWALAWRLAVGQLVAWGVLYYAFTVVVGPMQAATGWSRAFLNAGLSLGLLGWGILALPVGAWLQRRGGRGLMTLASALGGMALMLMGLYPRPGIYLAAWLMLGAAMAGLLYDPAFAVVTRAFGPHYRRGITLITLVGGFASTVFIPVAQVAVANLGWQSALVALGALHLAVGVPLHAFAVPQHGRVGENKNKNENENEAGRSGGARLRWRAWWMAMRRDVSDPRFVGLAVWFTAHAAAFTGLIFQLVPILQARQVEQATLLRTLAIIGPTQVLGRLLLSSRSDRFSPLRVGRWAMVALVAALLILLLMPPRLGWLALFAALYGVGNGVTTILRGTAIAELFGRQRYAELNGALSAPAVLAKAAAPLTMAGLWSVTGEPRVVVAGVLGLVLAGVGGLGLATVAQRRAQKSSVACPVGPDPIVGVMNPPSLHPQLDPRPHGYRNPSRPASCRLA